MSKGIGRQIQIGVARETVRGTPVTSPAYWLPTIEHSIDEKDMKVLQEQAYSVIEDSLGYSVVKQWAEGNVKAYLTDKDVPLLLYSLLGTLASAAHGVEVAVYDHTITVAQTVQHQSLTLLVNDLLSGQDYKHANGMITSMEITFETGKILEYSVTFKTRKGASTTLSVANTSQNIFLPQHLIFKLASSKSGLGAASAITSLKKLSLNINQNVVEDDVLGTLTAADFLNQQLSIEGKMEFNWTDETYRDYFENNTNKAMRLDILNDNVTLGSAANPELKIDLSKVSFVELSREMGLNNIVKQTLAFRAHYSSSDTEMISVVATNSVASY